MNCAAPKAAMPPPGDALVSDGLDNPLPAFPTVSGDNHKPGYADGRSCLSRYPVSLHSMIASASNPIKAIRTLNAYEQGIRQRIRATAGSVIAMKIALFEDLGRGVSHHVGAALVAALPPLSIDAAANTPIFIHKRDLERAIGNSCLRRNPVAAYYANSNRRQECRSLSVGPHLT